MSCDSSAMSVKKIFIHYKEWHDNRETTYIQSVMINYDDRVMKRLGKYVRNNYMPYDRDYFTRSEVKDSRYRSYNFDHDYDSDNYCDYYDWYQLYAEVFVFDSTNDFESFWKGVLTVHDTLDSSHEVVHLQHADELPCKFKEIFNPIIEKL